MRVATIPTVQGEKLVLRLLTKSNVLTGLKQLGLEPDDEQRLRSLIAKPQGMILATGPVGSGKTTTLYAALNKVNILTNNIVTAVGGLVPGQQEWQFADGVGCEACYYTGYLGRTGLFEILRVSETLRHLITDRASEQESQAAAVREGMHTLQQNGIAKIIQGTTTPPEVMREVYL
jgi:type II secretory ATPase GspE/PulE/Tfp pilus assembly ATPase PilB-like protein